VVPHDPSSFGDLLHLRLREDYGWDVAMLAAHIDFEIKIGKVSWQSDIFLKFPHVASKCEDLVELWFSSRFFSFFWFVTGSGFVLARKPAKYDKHRRCGQVWTYR
jgi:hypothetical protein